jgi:hypothetical protein
MEEEEEHSTYLLKKIRKGDEQEMTIEFEPTTEDRKKNTTWILLICMSWGP